MSSQPSRKRTKKKLSAVELRDLTRHAVQRADTAVGDACQLIDDNTVQYMLVINVIGNLIVRATHMYAKPASREDITFTIDSIKEWLDRAK
jgi:hypothetical protein